MKARTRQDQDHQIPFQSQDSASMIRREAKDQDQVNTENILRPVSIPTAPNTATISSTQKKKCCRRELSVSERVRTREVFLEKC